MARSTFDVSLLRWQIADKRRHRSIKTLYGDRHWVDELDIVNELGGHTGCVNALSWSKSGRLLASGSDDTHLNIWAYNPDSQARPFSLDTSVSTGHTQNIFSVKFMPHSNDRTVITAAGDSQVRIFDIEHGQASGTAATADPSFSASTRSRRFHNFFSHAKYLNEGNTNARLYRSHADRVKRIVTESSPHLFLTCSEDGEVRQWDLRQPSSAYPPPRGGTGYSSYRLGEDHDADNVPPPLISYKKYSLDLNSISCAASQPQYIALGGAHLHCFLHDRRMLGRDLSSERGHPGQASVAVDSRVDEEMSGATRCVRRFAPNEKRKMGTHGNGHITACKISDANPNEMIASWSGDHVYSFDLVKSPDARDEEAVKERAYQVSQGRLRDERNLKRKRAKATASSSSLVDNATGRRRLRKVPDDQPEGHTALRVRYGNGQTEDISISVQGQSGGSNMEGSRDVLLTETQKLSARVARSLVKLRKTMFDFSAATQRVAESENPSDLTPYTPVFTDILGQTAALLTQMDAIIRDWSYPMDPSPEDVRLQQTMRRNRQASWRLVQASGCLAKTLGGRLQTLSPTEDPRLALFDKIRPAPREGGNIESNSRFCYDFLKAILLWLGGGKAAVVEGFKRPAEQSNESQRFPLNTDDQVGIDEAIDVILGYFSSLASDDHPLVDLDTNRFERDDSRLTFESQKIAVEAFSRALKGTHLRPNGESDSKDSEERIPSPWIYKRDACKFWGVKVGRALLMDASEGVNFAFVNQSFGGVRLHIEDEAEPDRSLADSQFDQEVEGGESSEPFKAASAQDPIESSSTPERATTGESGIPGRADIEATNSASIAAAEIVADAEEDDDDNDASDSDRDQSDAEDDENDDAPSHPLFRRRAAFGRARERAVVNQNVPYSCHTRTYKGHCNTKTVKDVNFYGLDDEYVVSGSDSGHFFIWDRKTTEVVNILEGDGEVVNVVQGHPYEPMIAVSGIDSTVKIFGIGGREQEDAAKGINIANPGGGRHSSLRLGGRRRRHGPMDDDEPEVEGSVASNGLPSRKAMHKSYEIMSQNELDRTVGVGDAFITRGMLARLAAHINQGQMAVAALGGGGGGEGAIVIDDNCTVM